MLRTYRDATTRYGTPEEWRLAQKLLVDLQAARTTYGQRAGVTLPAPTAKQRSQARALFEAALVVVANEQIARWTGDQGLADALTAGGIATVKVQLRQELATRLRTQAEKAITNATGFAVVLNVPLKQQVRLPGAAAREHVARAGRAARQPAGAPDPARRRADRQLDRRDSCRRRCGTAATRTGRADEHDGAVREVAQRAAPALRRRRRSRPRALSRRRSSAS